MVSNKSSDEVVNLIAALLRDVQTSHGLVFTPRACRLTTQKVAKRYDAEGISFLTKTLPRLGKAFDKALSLNTPLNATSVGFASLPDSKLPRFLGEFFSKVLNPDGTVLQDPCAQCVEVIRQITYLFYKYELPYTDDQEQQVISSFKRTEDDILARSESLRNLRSDTERSYQTRRSRSKATSPEVIAREARILLARVFSGFDFTDIVPKHGPGAVATKQRLWDKYLWTNVSNKIRKHYPLDAYFYASLSHVCDSIDSLEAIDDKDLPARVVLVPKDSRGPRLISCEPVDYQWIQQGIMTKLVQHVETLDLTRFNVFFTDQVPNQIGALYGSRNGRYATLDLKEASDRISLDLVRLIFPEHVVDILESVRSSSTELPNGEIINLHKHAPMGSALCFPILALSVWAILTAAVPDADTRESILVYGDDVIVPTAYAANAIERLELFGLLVNRDKSCTSGFFRESCGMDAFKGVPVTPVRFRTVWSSTPCPNVYTSWIAYANSMYAKRYFNCYDYIVGMLFRVYGTIPSKDMHLACPSLVEVPEYMVPKHTRTNRRLQKRQWKVWDVKAPTVMREIDGWSMLLRFFTESGAARSFNKSHKTDEEIHQWLPLERHLAPRWFMGSDKEPFSVRLYTKRRTSMLVRRWR